MAPSARQYTWSRRRRACRPGMAVGGRSGCIRKGDEVRWEGRETRRDGIRGIGAVGREDGRRCCKQGSRRLTGPWFISPPSKVVMELLDLAGWKLRDTKRPRQFAIKQSKSNAAQGRAHSVALEGSTWLGELSQISVPRASAGACVRGQRLEARNEERWPVCAAVGNETSRADVGKVDIVV